MWIIYLFLTCLEVAFVYYLSIFMMILVFVRTKKFISAICSALSVYFLFTLIELMFHVSFFKIFLFWIGAVILLFPAKIFLQKERIL